MLNRLTIKNFAIIEALEIEFENGLNILTGETGAGKSILIGALGLILGDRLTDETLRSGAEKGEVEACFSLRTLDALQEILEESAIEAEDNEIIVRRTFTQAGRNRCFLNGTSVTLSFLKNLGNKLVDIHGQHDHQTLIRPENQLRVLDAYADVESDAKKLKVCIADFYRVTAEKEELDSSLKAKNNEADLLRFQVEEISNAQLSPEEDEQLAKERELMQSSEKRFQLASSAYENLYGGENASVERLSIALQNVEILLSVDQAIEKQTEEFRNIMFRLEDISSFLRDYVESTSYDPERLSEVDDRVAEIKRLKRKYGNTVEDILEKKESFEKELSLLDDDSDKKEKLERELNVLQDAIIEKASQLATVREKAGKKFGVAVEKELKELKMEKVSFFTNFQYEDDLDSFITYKNKNVRLHSGGIGRMEFHISTNSGVEPKPMSKIASGGELSRIMLALKKVLSEKDFVPVHIFDEIDTGISGGVAEIVGKKINEVARNSQVFCVTHQPQIASRGVSHFLIEKKMDGAKTQVGVRKLCAEERVEEIARMAGGVEVSAITRKHAHEMLLKGREQ